MGYKDPDKQREYQRRWIRKRREDYLKDKECKHCGTRIMKNLTIHHRDPKKKLHHAIWSWAKVRREAELAKCDVACKLCHVEEHRTGPKQVYYGEYIHGTSNSYKNGCRCSKCKLASSFYIKLYSRGERPGNVDWTGKRVDKFGNRILKISDRVPMERRV